MSHLQANSASPDQAAQCEENFFSGYTMEAVASSWSSTTGAAGRGGGHRATLGDCAAGGEL